MKTTLKDKRTSEKVVLVIAFFAWFAFNLFLTVRHEQFRDEAQSWLIAKDASIPEMIGFMWQEGHPWLWHLIIYPFVRLGFAYANAKYIALTISTAAILLFIHKSPLKTIWSIVFMALPCVNYFGPSMARPYCLIIVSTVLIMITWQNRKEHPFVCGLAIGLLYCSHILMWGFALLLTVIFFADLIHCKRFGVGATLAVIVPFVVFCVPIFPQALRVLRLFDIPLIAAPFIAVIGIAALVFITIWCAKSEQLHNALTNRLSGVCIHSIILMVMALYLLAAPSLFTSVTNSTGLTARYTVINIPVYFALVVVLHLIRKERETTITITNKGLRTVRNIFVGAGCVGALFFGSLLMAPAFNDIYRPYSGGPEMAAYINAIDDDAPIIAGHLGEDTAVAANLTNKEVTKLLTGEPLTYTHWFTEWRNNIPASEWCPELKSVIEHNQYIYFLGGINSDFLGATEWLKAESAREGSGVVLLYENKDAINYYESFALYKIDSTAVLPEE